MLPNPQIPADLVIFTGDILNGKLHFLSSVVNVVSRGGFRDFEKGGALCRAPWLDDEENFRFQMV